MFNFHFNGMKSDRHLAMQLKPTKSLKRFRGSYILKCGAINLPLVIKLSSSKKLCSTLETFLQPRLIADLVTHLINEMQLKWIKFLKGNVFFSPKGN